MRSNWRNMVTGLMMAVASWGLAGCGDGEGGQGPAALVIEKAPGSSGDQQTGAIGSVLSGPLRIRVTRDGAPEPNVTVLWSTSQGSVNPLSFVTGADGIATTTWKLGTSVGAQSAEASVSGAVGSPIIFTASATPPTPPGGPN
jgi:hypothetical protein